MNLAEFQKKLRGRTPERLADEFLNSRSVAAFSREEDYLEFQSAVISNYKNAERIAVVGTANWKFSLNPVKRFKPFDHTSDIDTVVVSESHFVSAWDQLRAFDRKNRIRLPQDQKEMLRRNAENVYAGFVTPTWIPDKRNQFRFEHERILNRLSNKLVDHKPVKIFFFRNWAEAVDYYCRGIRIAQTGS